MRGKAAELSGEARKALEKKIDRRPKKCAVLQNRRDVFEDDAFLGKIGHVANTGPKFVDYVRIHESDASGGMGEVNGEPSCACGAALPKDQRYLE